MKRVAIIDGDILCYLSFEPRWNYTTKADGTVISTYNPKTDKYEKEVKTYTKEEDAKYLRESWERFQKKTAEAVEEQFCTEYLMAVQGPDNYRVDLFDLYKQQASRTTAKPSEITKFVPILRKLAIAHGLAIGSDGREADDYIRMWAEESRAAGIDFVICSNDKDLLCIPGKHFNLKTKIFSIVDKAAALRLYYEQLLQGDATDNIPGIPGIGPKKAAKILAHCTTVGEFQKTVVNTYIASFETNWKQHLLSNGKLIHIQRHEYDWFDLKDWPVVQELEYAAKNVMGKSYITPSGL